MDILESLVQLRDDLKIWITNNVNAVNAKIDEKTIPIDNQLNSASTNPIQNQAVAKELAALAEEIRGIAEANGIVIDSVLNATSTNAIQNKAVYNALANKANNTTETWTFTLEDGSVITKTVVIA